MAEETRRTFSEQIETTGAQLLGQVKRLLAEGNARTLRIKEPDGDVVLEINLTVGALAGGAVVLGAPWLAVIGAIAALATRVSVEIIYDEPPKEGATPSAPGHEQSG
ncbi:MAG: DUF4342 domain-containing protein [Bauldia sp.]|nr:DUF4342 domain-containing protein [Bauldia sp.]